MKEIKKLRNIREKHFLYPDGTIDAIMYKDDIHYLKDGEYHTINNTIIDTDDKYYKNDKNRFKVYFPKCRDNRTIFKIDDEDYNIELSLTKDKTTTSVDFDKNSITFKNILESIDIKYEIIGSRLKESIILNKPITENLTFDLKTDLELIVDKGEIYGKKNNKILYKIATPFIITKDGPRSHNVTYSLSPKSTYHELTINLDTEWLQHQTFPLIIDPTIETVSEADVYDTYIYPGDDAVNKNDQEFIKIGVDSNNTIYRSLLKFELPTIATGSQIIGATMNLISYGEDVVANDLIHELVTVHEVTSLWTESTATWNNMNDKYSPIIEASTELLRTEYSLDENSYPIRNLKNNQIEITNLVKKWYSGLENKGLMIKFLNETYNPECKEYYMYSKNNTATEQLGTNPKPYLIIHYRNQSGLLNYMSYNNLSFKDGTSYINLYNGNVTNIFNLNRTIAGKFPISLNLVYNTNDILTDRFYSGWRFDLNQKLTPLTIDEHEYIEFLDSSSNISYFYKDDNGNYKDEDGKNLEITFSNNTYTMSDKNGNENIFELLNGEYLLTKITDSESNSVNLSYDSSNRLVKVKDANNEEITLTYQDSLITTTSAHMTSTITLSNNKVTSITTKNGTTTFEYNSNGLINKIKDTDNKGIDYEYYPNAPYRIKAIIERGITNTEGKSLAYTYSFNTTEITNNKNQKYTYTFNDQGNMIGTTIMDENGLLKDSYGLSSKYIETYGSNKNNKLSSSTSLLKYVDNLTINSSFEKDDFLILTGGSRTSETSRTGLYSYKGTKGVIVYGIIEYMGIENEFVTISGFIKCNADTTLEIYERTAIRDILKEIITIPANADFERFNFTMTTPMYGGAILFTLVSEDDFYIDDIQVELGSTPNPYNIITNSRFADGLTDWTVNGSTFEGNEYSDCYEIVNLNNFENALKIKSRPDSSIGVSQEIIHGGTKGDVYNLSFWYKNEGIIDTNYEYAGNLVNIQFLNPESELGSATHNIHLNIHDEKWHYFSESFVAENDYTSLAVNILSLYESNNLYITNLMLIEYLGQNNYTYDDEGNLCSIIDMTGEENKLNYDTNNKLISIFTPKGNSFTYEYDNTKKGRVLKGVSPTGISNGIQYDINGNPVKTIINNVNSHNTIQDGKSYYIRLKGTNEYMDCNYGNNKVYTKENKCNTKPITLEKEEYLNRDFYHLKMANKYICCRGDGTVLTNIENEGTRFNITKLSNGSYNIRPLSNPTTALTRHPNKIITTTLDTDDYNQQFYFEDIDSHEFIETKAEYTEDGKYVTKITDTLGKETIYDIDKIKGLTNSVINDKGESTEYTYNNKDQLASVTNNGKTVNYEYNEQNLLSSISTGNKDYTFEYDDFSKPKTVKINDTALVTNIYETQNGNLLSSTYGNNDTISYTYDKFDRIATITNAEKQYTYSYNSLGNISKIESSDEKHFYLYDFANRLSEYISKNDTYEKLSVAYEYDTESCIIDKKITINDNVKLDTSFEYNPDNSIIKVSFDTHSLNYNYDKLGRLLNKNIDENLNIEYKYCTNGNKTSLVVKSVKIDADLYEYRYDDLYNITDIYLNGLKTNHYVYDSFNELIEDDNYTLNKTYRFTYDNEGNILKKREYVLDSYILISEDTYEYNNPNWEDQMTKFNDESITYDEIGNPLTIGNKTLTWTNGRQLKSYTDSSKNLTANYRYNKDSIRISKTINGTKTDYFIEGANILVEKTGTSMIYFIHDEVNSLVGFKHNDATYYYIKNLQEDIIGIKDSSFNTIANYTYDAWGKLLKVTDAEGIEITDYNHIAHINPFRYRSYYYDKETELYYLNSRYYNPNWGRFINADQIVHTAQGMLSANMYTYTENNPINRIDINGLLWFQVAGTIGGALIAIGFQVISNYKNGDPLNKGIVQQGIIGGIGGLMATTTFGTTATGLFISTYGLSLLEAIMFNSDSIFLDTIINGSVGIIAGDIADEIVPINKGWFKPKKFKSSFIGKYTQKLNLNSFIAATYEFLLDTERYLENLKKEIDETKTVKSSPFSSGAGHGGGFSGSGGFAGGGGGGGRGF